MKTGLIVEGGGMKSAYSAGVLDAFLDHDIHFDVVTGVSAGAANAASFLAGQRDRNRRFYVEYSMDEEYFGWKNYLKTGSAFGLEYIYGNVSGVHGKDPLDYDAIMANPSEFFFPATDAKSGNPHYFNKDTLLKDHNEPFMATCALPVMCKPVKIGGHEYFDGGCTDSLPVGRLRKMGCDKIVVIFSKPDDFHMKPQGHRGIYTLALQKYPNMIYRLNHRHEVYNKQVDHIIGLREHDMALTFAPTAEHEMKTTTMDTEVLQAMYDQGLAQGNARAEEVREFLCG